MVKVSTALPFLVLLLCTDIAVAEGLDRKAEFDRAARTSSFPDADYPYYSAPNGCGPDDWKSRLVPQRSHVFTGPDFAPSCDTHDRGYMTLKRAKETTDRTFRDDLNRALADWLKELVAEGRGRLVKQLKIVRRKVGTREVKAWATTALDPLGVVVRRKVPIYEYARTEVEVFFERGSNALLLGPDRVAEMKVEIQAYYQAVRNAGGPYYNDAQKQQRLYEEWLRTYQRDHPS